MEFSIAKLVAERNGEQFKLHTAYLNEQMPKVLKTIGFAKNYVRAEGAYLFDDKGERYLDFLAGFGSFNLGRYHPVVVAAIQEALALKPPTLIQMDAPLLAGLLAEQLVAIAPAHLSKVYFTNSGTESVEVAIKMARRATRRNRVVYLKKAFHGLTCGSLSVCGAAEFREGFGPLLPGCEEIYPNDLAALKEKLAQGDVAAFIFEPIQGKGVFVQDKDFITQAQALCREYGALFIADEIQTGFGRTGRMFCFEHFGLEPDIVCIAKSLGGGLVPVGALLMRAPICNATFDRMENCYVQSSTFKMNALAMAAGLATLHVIKTEKLVENAAKCGARMREGLEKLIPKFEHLGAVRGLGLMVGVEMQKPQSLRLKMEWNLLNKMSSGLFSQVIVMTLMEKHRILTQVAGNNVDIIKCLPPLVISEQEVDYFLLAFEAVCVEASKFPGPIWDFGSSLVKNSMSA